MKKIYLLFLFGIWFVTAYSQPWMDILRKSKPQGDYTFFDYQKAFRQWEKQQGIIDGYIYKDGKKVKVPYWKLFKRWEWEKQFEVNMLTGEFPSQTPEQIYADYLKNLKKLKAEADIDYSHWQTMGPFETTGGYHGLGRVNRVAFHPADTNTYWVGTPAGGLWVTHDDGQTWTPLTDTLLSLGISDIAIHPAFDQNNTIFIATGDRDSWKTPGIGVLKSTDGGQTWQATGLSFSLGEQVVTSRVLIDPSHPDTMLASTTAGIYRSTDGGENWTKTIDEYFVDMDACPADFNYVLGSKKYDGLIMRSVDGGITWDTVYSNQDVKRIELAFAPSEPAIVYAVAVNSDGGLYGIYKSVDTGATFNLVYDGTQPYHNILGYYKDGSTTNGQGTYDLAIAVSPSDENILLVGGINTWKSTDGGTSWRIVNHWYGDSVQAVHADKHELRFRYDGALFEGNDGGIYKSNNEGESGSWVNKTNGLVISQMYKLGVTPQDYNEIITGLQDNGTKLHTGDEWWDVKGGDGMECIIDYTNLNIQYGTYIYGQISRTTDHWQSSVAIEPDSAGKGAWVTPYIINPYNPQILYAGYADLWKTYNRGDSWIKISDINTPYKIRSLAIAPSDTNVIYMADLYDIWKTTDGGQTWTEITGDLPIGASVITNIAVKYDDPNTVWVTLSGYNSDGVFQSIDGGNTWKNISDGLPEVPVYTVVQNRLSMDSVHLYAGTQVGVFFKNGAQPWVPYKKNLPEVMVYELEIYYSSEADSLSRLRAATFGRGLWETPLVPVSYIRPAVAIYYPDTITNTTIAIKSKVLTEGEAQVQLHGICWSTEPHPTIDDNRLINPDITQQPFIAVLENLKPGTKYYIRGFALNKYGLSYSSELAITTNPVCKPFDILNEDFETGTFPAGWTKVLADTGSSNNIIITDDYNHTPDGSYSLRFSSYYTSDNYNQYVFTNRFDLPENSILSMWVRKYNSTDEHLYYAITSDIDTAQNWTEIPLTTDWQQVNIDLSGYSGPSYLGLHYYAHYKYYVYVDDINIYSQGACIYAETEYDCANNQGVVSAWLSINASAVFFLLDSTYSLIDSLAADTNNAMFYVDQPGTYYVTARVYGYMTDTVSVVYMPVPLTAPDSVALLDASIAPGETTVLHYYGGSGDRFVWYQGQCGGTTPVGYGNDVIVTPTGYTVYYGRWENDCQASECKSVAIFVPASVDADKQVIVYPNPTTGKLYIRVHKVPYKLDVYTISGKKLATYNANSNAFALNLSAYDAGMYIIRISTDEHTYTFRIIKQ